MIRGEVENKITSMDEENYSKSDEKENALTQTDKSEDISDTDNNGEELNIDTDNIEDSRNQINKEIEYKNEPDVIKETVENSNDSDNKEGEQEYSGLREYDEIFNLIREGFIWK